MRTEFTRILVAVLLLSLLSCKEDSPSPSGSITSVGGGGQSSGPLQVGAQFPTLDLKDLDGNSRSLDEFRGKFVVLNLWATWCNPCVAEMPALERLYQLVKSSGVEIVGISVDGADQAAKVKSFLRERGITFPILHDGTMKSAGQLGLSGFPETVFIDREGRIAAFFDPLEKRSTVRVVSDRPWDSPQYVAAVKSLKEIR